MRLYPDVHGPIAPDETILASIGMRPVITRAVEQITDIQWRNARDMQFTVNKMAHDLVTAELPDPEDSSDRPGYFRLLRDLSMKYEPTQVAAMIATLPDELIEVGGLFTMRAAQAFSLLASQLPRQVIKSVSDGAQFVPPPVRLLDRFDSLFNVLDRPLEILNRAGTGQLLKLQVQAVTMVYPSLMAYMAMQVAKEIVLERGQDAGFMLPRRAEIGCETLLGVDVTSSALRTLLKMPPPPVEQEGPPPGESGVGTPKEFMTRTQRTDANAP